MRGTEKIIITNTCDNGILFFRGFFFHFLTILPTILLCLPVTTAPIRNSNGRDNVQNAKLGERLLKELLQKEKSGKFKKSGKFDKFLDCLTKLLEKWCAMLFGQLSFPTYLVAVLFPDRLSFSRENPVSVSLLSHFR